jgi:putative Mn2+ efflux pump MntP
MDIITTFVVALGLAMDVFAVSLGIGTSGRANAFRPVFRIAFHAGLFQGLMTGLGWLAGSTIAGLISGIDHWVALGLLAFVGIRMVRSGIKGEAETHTQDPSRGKTLMMVCVATSIDAMAVGLSLAMLQMDIVLASLIIGVTSLVLSVGGLLAGNGLGQRFGKRMEVLGGLLLNGIGIRILISHLF